MAVESIESPSCWRNVPKSLLMVPPTRHPEFLFYGFYGAANPGEQILHKSSSVARLYHPSVTGLLTLKPQASDWRCGSAPSRRRPRCVQGPLPHTEPSQLAAQPHGCMEMHNRSPIKCHPWLRYDGTTQTSAWSERSADEDAGFSRKKKALFVARPSPTAHKFRHPGVAPGSKRFQHVSCCSLKDVLLESLAIEPTRLFSLKISGVTKAMEVYSNSSSKWAFDVELNRHLFYMDDHFQLSGKTHCKCQTTAGPALLSLG